MVFKKKRAASPFAQMWFLIQRFIVMYWRTPTYNLTRIVIALGLALISGLTYINSEFVSYQGINGGVGMVFLTALFMGIATFTGALPITALDRAAFYRERASQTYNSLWYFVVSTVVKIPYVFFSCCCSQSSSTRWWGSSRSLGRAVLDQPVVLRAHTGVPGPGADLRIPKHRSIGYRGRAHQLDLPVVCGLQPSLVVDPGWIQVVVHHHAPAVLARHPDGAGLLRLPLELTWNETLGVYENVSSHIGCQPVTDLPVTIDHITVKGYVESVFKCKYDEIWANFGYVFVVLGIFRLLAVFSLRYINHTQR